MAGPVVLVTQNILECSFLHTRYGCGYSIHHKRLLSLSSIKELDSVLRRICKYLPLTVGVYHADSSFSADTWCYFNTHILADHIHWNEMTPLTTFYMELSKNAFPS